MIRTVLKWIIAAFLIYGGLLGGLFVVMMQPPHRFGRIMAQVPVFAFVVFPFKTMWNVARKGQLKVGDPAPDFVLSTVDRKAKVQLSSLRGQMPVVLIFGSHS